MTTIPQTEIGATLDPAALPAAVLAAIGACADACRATLTRLEGDRERLRGELSRRIRPVPDGPERRLCAVDGSHATVPAAGATFAAVAAVAVEDATLTDQQVLAPHLSGTVTDRTLWSTVLEPGEHSLPVPLIKRDRPHLLTGYRSPGLPDFAERRAAIEQGYGQLYVTYYRPEEHGPAYRLELP